MQKIKNFGKVILNKIYFPFLINGAIGKFQKLRKEIDSIDKAQALADAFSFGPRFRGLNINFRPAQQKEEILKLMSSVKKLEPKIILEIGTATGGTLFFWTQVSQPNTKIISIDLPFGKFGCGYISTKIKLFKSFALNNQKIELIRANSHSEETELKLKAILNDQKIDFLFIDGDHSYEGAKKDFDTYKKYVRSGGIIALHDIARTPSDSQSKVEILWDEIKNKYRSEEYINDENQKWAGIGVIYLV